MYWRYVDDDVEVTHVSFDELNQCIHLFKNFNPAIKVTSNIFTKSVIVLDKAVVIDFLIRIATVH